MRVRHCMALYPRQNSSFCMQHCCFQLMLVFSIQYLTSIIQHCALTIQHPYFKMQYSTSTIPHFALTIQRPSFVLCIVRYVCIAIQHSCFTSSQTKSHILNSTFLPLHATFVYFTATLMLDVCDARCRVRYACSAMQHSCLDIELHA